MHACNQIVKKIEGKEEISNSASVKVTRALNSLLDEELVTRKYVERESWYRITEKGKDYLRKSQAETEISSEKLNGFANCEVVLSSNGETDASVYFDGPIDSTTKTQIKDILTKYPGIKILGHTKKRGR